MISTIQITGETERWWYQSLIVCRFQI